MKILVYGGNGWIGQQFIEILQGSQIEYICGRSRVDNNDDLIKEIENINPTHIISFIGRTHGKIGDKVYSTIDYLEEKGKLVENIRDNLYSPLLLCEICRNKNIHYTYLGTGCIFSYDEVENNPKSCGFDGFFEHSHPNFFGSSYSVVKGFTDRLMHLYDKDVLNLRIRMPIDNKKNPRNFITKITSYEKICSIHNSMTVLPELLPYVLDMMKRKITGTVNLTNPGLISHNEILQMYRDIIDPTFKWKNFTEEEQRQVLAADRSNNYLNTNLLQSLYPDINTIHDAVYYCLLEYKKNLDSART
jgi:dTDP-4-dehydrorhamnose reductase